MWELNDHDTSKTRLISKRSVRDRTTNHHRTKHPDPRLRPHADAQKNAFLGTSTNGVVVVAYNVVFIDRKHKFPYTMPTLKKKSHGMQLKILRTWADDSE